MSAVTEQPRHGKRFRTLEANTGQGRLFSTRTAAEREALRRAEATGNWVGVQEYTTRQVQGWSLIDAAANGPDGITLDSAKAPSS